MVSKLVITGSMSLILQAGLVACGDDRAAPDAAPSLTFTPPAGPLCEPAVDGFGESECCLPTGERDVPSTVASVVDFTDIAAIPLGTCDNYIFDESPRRRGFQLSADPAAYPMKVRLPVVQVQDPACAELCNREQEVVTLFGIALDVDHSVFGDGERQLTFLVPAPWKFVSGGGGEAYPYPCMGGYQEFGGPRSCITIQYGGFGFATAEPTSSVLEALIELAPRLPLEQQGESHCCPYP